MLCAVQLFGLYKRVGQRVIVNSRGDLIVRPSLFELSMLQNVRGGATAHHLTVAYQNALVAIVTAQLKASSRHSDGLHGILGLLKEMPQVRGPAPRLCDQRCSSPVLARWVCMHVMRCV